MERKLLERMIGAGVLVMALVIAAPLLLDGGADEVAGDEDIPGQRSDELRTHVFRLDESRPVPAVVPGEQSPATTPAAAEPLVSEPAAPEPEPAGSVEPDSPVVQPTSQSPAAAPVSAAPIKVPDAPAPATAPPAAASGGDWLVQVGTFGKKDNAERLVASLQARGFEAVLSPAATGAKPLFRVRVGPAGSRAGADELRARLQAAGQAGQVVRR